MSLATGIHSIVATELGNNAVQLENVATTSFLHTRLLGENNSGGSETNQHLEEFNSPSQPPLEVQVPSLTVCLTFLNEN